MHVAIVGNGVTGVTAALRIRALRPDWRITLVSGESRYHYSRPALMYVFMGHMRYQDTKPFEDHFWGAQRLELLRGWVTRIDLEGKRLLFRDAPPLAWDKLLLATGSKSNRFDWPGQDLAGVQGLYGLEDLKSLYDTVQRARRAVIVGGGLIGIELAEMLHSRGIHVTFLVREASYWNSVLPAEESAMVNRVIREKGIDLHLATELAEIVDDGGGRCAAVSTKPAASARNAPVAERIECQLVGLTAGVSPNLDLVKDSPIATGRGILVDSSLRTSVPDVHAAGDCAEIVVPGGGRNLIQQVWYTGKLQGEVAGDVIAGQERSYEPGLWFNSAKFFDLEYQVYGQVDARASRASGFYYEHPDGKRSVRVAGGADGVVGFNWMGIRARHAVCERWIREKRPLDHVVRQLGQANFDPEFSARFERDVARALAPARSP